MSKRARTLFLTLMVAMSFAVATSSSVANADEINAQDAANDAPPHTAHDVVSDTASETIETPTLTKDVRALKCPHYKVYYIDTSAQFFTPPVPLEDHAEFVFCSEHENLDAIRTKLSKMKPIGSHADAGAARIKVVPKGKPGDALIFCSTGEITYRGKQYRLDRRFYEPSLLSLREEGDRQRAMAIEKEEEREDSRNPAGEKSAAKPQTKTGRKRPPMIVPNPETKTDSVAPTAPKSNLPSPTETPPGF
jgi:hypothetical protein